MVCFDVVADIESTSGHFEWASTMMKNILPMKGPAKSTCTLFHTHGCRGAAGSAADIA